MSIPMTCIGTWAPRSATKSNPSAPTSGSRHSAVKSRICCSSADTRFGVNARESSLRWSVCAGGSSKINVPGGCSTSALMSSSTLPLPLMKVSLSFSACSMSS